MIQNIEQNSRIHLIQYLLEPPIALRGKRERARHKPSWFKALVHLYQLDKNILSGKWKGIWQSEKRICSGAKISRSDFSEFINSSYFKSFGEMRRNKRYECNEYRIFGWTREVFQIFERLGMMKGIRENYEKWRDVFLKRLKGIATKIIDAGRCLKDLVINRLSTKRTLKGDTGKTLKGDTINPSGNIKPVCIRSKNFEASGGVAKETEAIEEAMRDRFGILEVDIKQIFDRFKLSEIRKACRIREEWKKNAIWARSPVKTFMACIKLARKGKMHVKQV